MNRNSSNDPDIGFRALTLAWSDEHFRRALLRDARGAVKEYFGYDLPEGANISVTEGATPQRGSSGAPARPRG